MAWAIRATLDGALAPSPIYIHGRDVNQVYNSDETTPGMSITLHGWSEITQWRADHEGSQLIKVVAEVGYLTNGIFGIIETAVRLPVCYVVGNSLSDKIALGIDFINGDDDNSVYKSYRATRKELNKSVDLCAQGVVQNLASLGTNPVSHSCNLHTSAVIKRSLEGEGERVVKIIEELVSPVLITSSIIGSYRNHS
jgi:hypothetical protein